MSEQGNMLSGDISGNSSMTGRIAAVFGKDGIGIPAGGEAGQVLKKASGSDYDTEWGNEGSGSASAVLYTAQTLTAEQKTQARANIGAGTVTENDLNELSDAFYADLENKQAHITPGENITITEDGVISAEVKIPRMEKIASDVITEIIPNTFYVFPEMSSLSVTFAAPSDTTVVNEYKFRFISGATATTLTLPSSIIGDITIEANKVYEISIIDNYLAYQSWAVSA